MTIEINRRALLTGLASLVAAPSIVRAQSIMPVRTMLPQLLLPAIHIPDYDPTVAYDLGAIVRFGTKFHVCIGRGWPTVPSVFSPLEAHL